MWGVVGFIFIGGVFVIFLGGWLLNVRSGLFLFEGVGGVFLFMGYIFDCYVIVCINFE